MLSVGEWRARVMDGGGFDDGVAVVRCKERASTWTIAFYESLAVRCTRSGSQEGGERRKTLW